MGDEDEARYQFAMQRLREAMDRARDNSTPYEDEMREAKEGARWATIALTFRTDGIK